MPNYDNGKIYSIRSYSRPDLIYVGSTTQPLSKRFGGHKKTKNSTSSKQIIAIGDAYIELIENYSCNSKEELDRREGQIIRSMDCVNKYIAGRTRKEYKKDNVDTIKEKNKEYRQDNVDSIRERMKQYGKTRKIECECGDIFKSHISRHLQTKKHKFYQTTYDYIYS
jgi:hypothetical protein